VPLRAPPLGFTIPVQCGIIVLSNDGGYTVTEEYYEKHQMEEDLGTDVEPYTEEELIELEQLEAK